MNKPIKSTDLRKKPIVAAIKKKANCRKVTCVRQVAPGVFGGDIMNPNGDNYASGLSTGNTVLVTAAEAGFDIEE